MKKVFYSDLDGTLFNYNSKGSFISNDNLNAINEFTKENYFGIATGRNVDSISKYFKNNKSININLPFVLMNGSCVYDINTDEVVYQDVLDKEVVMDAINYIEENPIGILLLIGPRKRYHVGKYDEKKFGKLSYEIEEVTVDTLDFNDVAKINFVIKEEYFDEIMKDIKNFKSFNKLSLIPASKRYVELVNKDTSKANGIKMALKYKEIKDYKLYAIGDYTNDYLMLKNADVSFAPNNAHKDIKEVANYVVSDHKEDAVKEALELSK